MRLGRSRKAVVVAEGEAATAVAGDEEDTAEVVAGIVAAVAVDRVEAAGAIVSQRSFRIRKAATCSHVLLSCEAVTETEIEDASQQTGRIQILKSSQGALPPG